MDLQQEADLLRKVPMFAKLEPSRLKLLAFTSEAVTFEDGEILCHQGDQADAAYVIMQGEVEILMDTDAGPLPVASLGQNELFGELAVLTNAPRVATLRAKSGLRALRITDEMFLKFLAENSEVALDVMRQLSHKIAQTHKRYEEMRRLYEEATRLNESLRDRQDESRD